MADFSPTQQEIQNTIDPEQNSVTIVDGTTPSYKATVNALGQLSVVVSGGGSAGFLTLDNQVAVLGTDVGRIIAGFDGTRYQFINVDSLGRIKTTDTISTWVQTKPSVGTSEVQIVAIPNQKFVRLVPLGSGTYYYGFASGVDNTFESFSRNKILTIHTDQNIFIVKATGSAQDIRVYQGA